MYQKVTTDMDFVGREKQVADFWKQHRIMEKSFHHRDGCERFTFMTARRPPTASRTSATSSPAPSRT